MAIAQIVEEKGISQEQIIETIEMAIAAAYKKDYGQKGQNIKIELSLETGEIKVYQIFLVVNEEMLKDEPVDLPIGKEKSVENVKTSSPQLKELSKEEIDNEDRKIKFNPLKHIMIDEAKKIKKKIKVNEELKVKLKPHTDFGRIAAQTAKQVIIQRLREAERESVYEEYKSKEGEIVGGIVQRAEGRNIFIDIGKVTGLLFPDEQIPGENYRIGQRLRVYILRVEKESRGTNIYLSRSYPKMVSKLFAIEVPEIATGTVTIKSIAREAGFRTKIAVYSEEEGVDPVGSLVGQKGIRVQTVINELNGEKIDIIEWDEDKDKFIANALSPAKVSYVELSDKKREASAIVPEDQLSLAIGQRGQNVRLAAKLTGWKIDVKNEEEVKKPEKTIKKKKITEKKVAKKTKKETTKKK